MSVTQDSGLPTDLRVLGMLRERVPHHQWDARRVIWAVRDFEHVVDVHLVAARCADWLAGPDATRVRDPHPQLRRYFEQEKERCAPNVTPIRRLGAYSGPDVVAAPSAASQRR